MPDPKHFSGSVTGTELMFLSGFRFSGLLIPIEIFCFQTGWAGASNKHGGNLGPVVMGGDSCSEGRGSNPGTVYWMNIF